MKKNQAYTFGLDKQVHGVPIIVFSFGHMSLVCFYVITAELFDNKWKYKSITEIMAGSMYR